MNLQSPASNENVNFEGKPPFLYVTANKNQAESLQQIIEGSANDQNNSSSQTDKLKDMSQVGHQFNALRAAEQMPAKAPRHFLQDGGDDHMHGAYERNVDASNLEDTLQRSMLIGDLRMDTSKDVLRDRNAQHNNQMSAFVDQDVSQSTSKLDMSMYGMDSMLQVAERAIMNPLKRPYSPPIKHLTSQQEEE